MVLLNDILACILLVFLQNSANGPQDGGEITFGTLRDFIKAGDANLLLDEDHVVPHQLGGLGGLGAYAHEPEYAAGKGVNEHEDRA